MTREIVGFGTAESDWQAWPGLHGAPELDLAELVPTGARVVVVAPHPDDELLAAAGTLSRLASAGRDLAFIAVTDGESSHPGSSNWSPTQLAEVRPGETNAALQVMGFPTIPHRLQLPDGGVAQSETELVDILARLFTEGDVVFTTWRSDGHPDHEATGRAVAVAALAVGATLVEMPIWMWHWADPGDPRVPWDRLAGVQVDDILLERKRNAIAEYVSQLTYDPVLEMGAILPPQVLARLLRGREFFFRPIRSARRDKSADAVRGTLRSPAP